MPTSSKTASDAANGTMLKSGDVDIFQAAAPTSGTNGPAGSNRWSGIAPHQPFSRGTSAPGCRCRSWMKIDPIDPGPLLRYLYVHHTAKSTSSSWRVSGRLPAAWAISQPAIAPTSCTAAVSRSTGSAWPVAKLTPSKRASARLGP